MSLRAFNLTGALWRLFNICKHVLVILKNMASNSARWITARDMLMLMLLPILILMLMRMLIRHLQIRCGGAVLPQNIIFVQAHADLATVRPKPFIKHTPLSSGSFVCRASDMHFYCPWFLQGFLMVSSMACPTLPIFYMVFTILRSSNN